MAADLTIYGTVDELQERWRSLDQGETTRATTLIKDANYLLRQIANNNGIDLDVRIAEDASGVYEYNVTTVILNAVQRELGAPTDTIPDATNWSQSATPYSEQMSFTGGYNSSLYFKQRELKLLGFNTVDGNAQISILRGARGANDGMEID